LLKYDTTDIVFPQLICSTGCITFLVFGEIFATPKTVYKYRVCTLYDRYDSLPDETYGENRLNVILAPYAKVTVLKPYKPKSNYPCILWLRPPLPNSIQNISVHLEIKYADGTNCYSLFILRAETA
jgi:hypothetical protein